MSEARLSRKEEINAKWEAFQPVKIEGKDQYTLRDIAKVFGVSHVTIWHIINGKNHEYSDNLTNKVRAFAQEVKYRKKLAEKEPKPEHISVHLSTRHYSSKQERSDHMLKLRDDGYTNAQIARFTGYDRKTVFRIIGAQPDEYTAMSHERAGKMRSIISEDRKALAAARQKKVNAANAQVESYNAAVDELVRLDEAVAMAKMKYIQQKSAVEKMHDALSSCAEYATIPIKPIPDAEQNGENRPN